MASSTPSLLEALRAPFEPSDLEWRAMFTRAGKDGKPPLVLVAPYVNRPALLNRLNQILGIEGWQTDARVSGGHVYVGLGIRTHTVLDQKTGAVDERWVWRWDGTGFLDADPPHFTASDAGKGDFSNAFKRACEMFGIAGYLRELKAMRAILDPEGRYKSNIKGHGVQRWNPPPLRGTPSYPGEIPGFNAIEGGPPLSAADAGDDPTEGKTNGPVPEMTKQQRKARIRELKDGVRAFMRANGYQVYNLDALVQCHSELKHRFRDGSDLGSNGDVEDWAEVESLTRRGQTAWDDAPKRLAEEFPTAIERVTMLRELMKKHKPSGQELVIIETAISIGWNDGVEYWITELGKRDG